MPQRIDGLAIVADHGPIKRGADQHGRPAGNGVFTIPKQPIRRRLQEMPPFVVTRGGEYCFAPGLRALRWLAELTS